MKVLVNAVIPKLKLSVMNVPLKKLKFKLYTYLELWKNKMGKNL